MQIKNFKDMYIAELQELVSVESQLDIALKRMADAASHPSLKRELLRHRTETKEQSKRLQSILQNHGAKMRAHTDQAMEALVSETEKMLSLLEGDDLRDAGLIASAQKLKHYEIAPTAPLRRSPVSSNYVTTSGCCTIASRRNGKSTPYSRSSPKAK